MFIEYDGYSPEKHALLTAQKIGEVCANVMDLGNYPSLSCCIKAGGKVAGLQSGSIHVTFLDQESDPHFSEAFTSTLMGYSKKLCQLGFDDSYRASPPDPAEKREASEASKALIRQAEDDMTRVAVLGFVAMHMSEFIQDWREDAAVMPILEVFSASAGSVEDGTGSNMPLIAEHATPDADVLV